MRQFARKLCRHSKGKKDHVGQPFEFTERIWNDWVKPLYGWRRPDGTRRFRETFCFMPKKNGKSTTAAVLTLYHLLADNEPAPEVYGAAKNRQQAGVVYNEVSLMIRSSPMLQRLTQVVESRRLIRGSRNGGIYRCLSADAGSQEGLNISALIRDELHALRDRTLFDALRYGGAARSQPMFIDITTAGNDKESICYDQYRHAKKILSGEKIDPWFLPVIYEADESDDPDDPAVWQKANPSWGVTIDPEVFRAEWERARESPASWAAWRRYRLNQWVETTSSWLPIDAWDACAALPEFAPGARVYGGLDLSSTTDLTAFVLWEPVSGSVLPFFWIPSEAFKNRERQNKERIDHWGREGLIRVIPGAMIDHDTIYKDVCEIVDRYRVKLIGADPYNAVDLICRLDKKPGLKVQPFRQGMLSMSPPTKRIEGLILDGKVRHGGHPVLRWCVKNVAVKIDESDNRRPVKDRSADKIDGAVALIMAVGVQIATGDKSSVYDRGQGL